MNGTEHDKNCATRLNEPGPCDCQKAETCNRCGNENAVWAASSPLWNAVMRGGSINGRPIWNDMVCAACFMQIAETEGIASGFYITADQVNVELETVTPSGRVWDEKARCWIKPALDQPSVEVSEDAVEDAARAIAEAGDSVLPWGQMPETYSPRIQKQKEALAARTREHCRLFARAAAPAIAAKAVEAEREKRRSEGRKCVEAREADWVAEQPLGDCWVLEDDHLNEVDAAVEEAIQKERERMREEPVRLAAFEKLTEGNYMRFTDPEGQEPYVWAIIDAVLDTALKENHDG